MFFKEQYQQIKDFAEDIYYHPELGYKEHRTKENVVRFLKEVNPDVEIEYFSTTGLKTTLGPEVCDTHIAFIAELDAVYTPSHMYADKETGAAHNCGHYTQVAIALAIYRYYVKTNVSSNWKNKISFIFVPAEEYLDLAYRDALIEQGTITHYGGKPEAMKLGVFDDIDVGVCVHAIGGEFDNRTVNVNCDLAGFLYKKYTFQGKATHAGFDPFSSKNAYSMSTVFNTAVGLMRQQLDEKEHVRMNPIVMSSDMSTNVIPNKITVGTDLRTKTVDYLKEAATKLDDAAKGSAIALQGDVAVHTQMGYLPFIQNRYLSTFVQAVFNDFSEIDAIDHDSFISAAGDIGDLSYMIPCIQIGYSGFTGTIHGDDFIDVDPEFIYSIFPEFVADVLENINENVDKQKLYRRSYSEYLSVINQIVD
ncbi:M20/M25/M40 family metallo-hydrolase [Oceanobacillus sp. CFH 90083]|uniref:M20/M25/M40 family metallo-hydrolase n=1 Tax=Oceanobacillus sp. CFH 90083 TaxID=2592336 RepID=UPI00128C2DD0|nr:M20/M25/M40 family metallo-hydrolase [Oceanobacillus sp. CFH 90083]